MGNIKKMQGKDKGKWLLDESGMQPEINVADRAAVPDVTC